MRPRPSRTALTRLGLTTCALGVAAACGTFSGSDAQSTDAGDTGDTGASSGDGAVSSDAGLVDAAFDALVDTGKTIVPLTPPICDMDAAGTLYCDSFELPSATCGGSWVG